MVPGGSGVKERLGVLVQDSASPGAENVDALLIRAMLLSCTSDPAWLELAQQTLQKAQELAPRHPRLPLAEVAYFRRTR